jgi:hypothetical protein
MAGEGKKAKSRKREGWEEEVLFPHHWGRHGQERAEEERTRLKRLREDVYDWSEAHGQLVEQIRALEICNWDLEESFLALCLAIGTKTPTPRPIGHLASVTAERWRKIWAYYLALRDWLPREMPAGYDALLQICDVDRSIRQHINEMLGEPDEQKSLFVERLCHNLSFWLGGVCEDLEKPQPIAHSAAVAAMDDRIHQLNGDEDIRRAILEKGDRWLLPCHHKTFRRYDIIISSIGAGKWRAKMPLRGTDGFERAETLERYLSPAVAWVDERSEPKDDDDGELFERIAGLLGERDNGKVFLVSLLVSLLRAQQLFAVNLAEKRVQKS